MSLAATLDAACAEGKLIRSRVKALEKSCCLESELEVIDFDAYAHSVGGVIPATADGVRCDSVEHGELLLLLEMKGLKNVNLNFHYQKCKAAERGETPAETTSRCQPKFQAFLKQKILGLNLLDKQQGTQHLLEKIYPELPHDFSAGTLSGRYFLVVDFSYREIINQRSAFRAALKLLTAENWGEPSVLPCDMIHNEESLRQYIGA